MPRTAWQRCGWRIHNYAAISICTTNPRSGAARAAPAGLPEPIRLCGDLRIRHGQLAQWRGAACDRRFVHCAQAQPVPTFSTHEYCQRIANLGGVFRADLSRLRERRERRPRGRRVQLVARGRPAYRSPARPRRIICDAGILHRGRQPTEATGAGVEVFPAPSRRSGGTPYNTMQDCLAAREQLAAGSAFCIGR